MAADTGCEYRDVVFHSEADMVRLKPQAVQRQIVPVEFPARLLAADFPVHGGKHSACMRILPMARHAGIDPGHGGTAQRRLHEPEHGLHDSTQPARGLHDSENNQGAEAGFPRTKHWREVRPGGF